MLRYLVAGSVALYIILLIFGDESRRTETVARAASDDATGLSLAALSLPANETMDFSVPASAITEAEAVEIAIQAGATQRQERRSAPLRGIIAAVESVPQADSATDETPPELWYVTGSRVNLRAGPGTGNDVVGQLTLGTEAEVIGDKGGWYQVRTVDGAMTGWISAKFLDSRKPG